MIGNGSGTSNIIVSPVNTIYQALDTVGDGSGLIAQNVNGSITPVKFLIKPPSTHKYILKRMNVHAIDANFNNALNYGTISTLANGIRVYIENDIGIVKEYTSNFKIKHTHDWALLAGTDSITEGSAGADPLTVRWTFARGCSDIVLDGSKNERLVVEIQDDLSGLDEQSSVVQGCRILLQ